MEPWMLDPTEFTPLNVSMFGKRYVKRWQASVKRYRTYDYWRQLFWTAAISRFEWEGFQFNKEISDTERYIFTRAR